MIKEHFFRLRKFGLMTQLFAILALSATLFSVNGHSAVPKIAQEDIDTIIWTDHQGNKPISWARFEGFYQLREFVFATLQQPVVANKEQKASNTIDRLILLSSSERESYELTLTADGIWYDSRFYNAAPAKVEYFRNFNQQRILKGDVISQAGANKIIQRYGVRH